MNLNRRSFLRALIAAPFAGAVAKLFQVTSAISPIPPLIDEMNRITLREIYPAIIEDEFFRAKAFMDYLSAHPLTVSDRRTLSTYKNLRES